MYAQQQLDCLVVLSFQNSTLPTSSATATTTVTQMPTNNQTYVTTPQKVTTDTITTPTGTKQSNLCKLS
jgi:hypothetical protein